MTFNTDEKWETLATLGEVQKNKTSKVKITRVRFKDSEYVQQEVWKKNEDGTEMPMRGQRITLKPEVANAVGKILMDS